MGARRSDTQRQRLRFNSDAATSQGPDSPLASASSQAWQVTARASRSTTPDDNPSEAFDDDTPALLRLLAPRGLTLQRALVHEVVNGSVEEKNDNELVYNPV